MDAVLDAYAPFDGKLAFPAWVEQVYGPAFAAEATAQSGR
jgi:hypothetical protein